MTAVEVLVLASGALLTASALLALVRMARGPSGLDRAVAADVLVAVLTGSVAAYTVATRTSVALGLILVLSLVGFTGAVAIARFVTGVTAREHRFWASTESGGADRPDADAAAPDADADPDAEPTRQETPS